MKIEKLQDIIERIGGLRTIVLTITDNGLRYKERRYTLDELSDKEYDWLCNMPMDTFNNFFIGSDHTLILEAVVYEVGEK